MPFDYEYNGKPAGEYRRPPLRDAFNERDTLSPWEPLTADHTIRASKQRPLEGRLLGEEYLRRD